MKKIVYPLLAASVVFVLLLGACAAPQKPAVAPAPTPQRAAEEKPQLSRAQQVVEAAKKEGAVELWTMSWPTQAGLEKAFEARYPFLKLKVWDAPTATGMTARLLEEAKIGRYPADVIIIPEADTPAVMSGGLVQEHEWPKGWPGQPTHKFWLNIASSAYFPIYNTGLVSAAEAPKSLEDLKNPKWRGRAVISTSGRGIPLHTAWILGKGKVDIAKSENFWREVVASTRPRVMRGFGEPVQLLAAGEYAILLMSAQSTATQFIWMGAPVAPAAMEVTGVDGYSLALLKNPPHPNAAQLLLDFFSGVEGNVLYADVQALGAYNPEAAKKARATGFFKKYGLNLTPVPAGDLYTDANSLWASKFWSTDLHK